MPQGGVPCLAAPGVGCKGEMDRGMRGEMRRDASSTTLGVSPMEVGV